MKKVLTFFACFISLTTCFAQEINRRDLEDSVIGWIKVYNFKGAKQPMTVDGKVYSVAQMSICDSLANWIQASYIPKGGLGDVIKSVTGKLGLYNKNDSSLPQSYGAYAKTYFFLKYNSNGKLTPATNHSVDWGVMANGVPGWEVRDISTPTQYYFTMPSFENSSDPEQTRKRQDLSDVESLKPYTTFWVRDIEVGGGSEYVLMSKDNKFPFIKLTKGEYLQLLEEAIPRFHAVEKKKIYEQNQNNQKSIDYFMKYLDEKIERFKTGLKQNREKYKNRMDEVALTTAQPTLYELENGRDVFSSGYLTDKESTSGRVPVYKIDPAMSALCKKDNPQWILMSWWWSPNDPVERHMHESIINNFNFKYVYDFFFDPQKVKGQAYKPVRSPLYTEAIVKKEGSESRVKNNTNENVYYFEDFSNTPAGKKPIGWRCPVAFDGGSAVTATLEGMNGNWVVMNGDYSINPTQLKQPLPKDFTISYDLVAAQNFTWGAKGLNFQLSKQLPNWQVESYWTLRLRPGFDGREGETNVESNFPSAPGYSNRGQWFKAPGFSNNKKNNHILVSIKKSGEMLQVFIDKNKIAEFEKAIPAGQLFNAFAFSSGSSGDTNKYYISNIKITKD